ncbi:hypothetical protein [Micromonospora parva]|uniref:hypothetical protein n=1 Tax=Micromonospora parva TaxID=1464048 RepID=UPI003658140C
MKDLGGAILGSLIPAGLKVDEMKGPFQRLSEAIERNKGLLQEAARIGANAIFDLVRAGISNLPGLIGMFRNLSIGVLGALDGLVSGAEAAFGWIPGIGAKFEAANREFDKFKSGYLRGLGVAEQATRRFSQEMLPRLERNNLKMNIDNWRSQIATAKQQMNSVPPVRQAELKARIKQLEASIASANRQLNALDGKTATTYIVTVRQEVRETIARGNTSGRPRSGEGGVSKFATGGLVGFPGGGYVRGPGTSTSDSVLARVSNGEYVIKAAAVRRYGARMFDDLNAMRVQLATSTMSVPARPAANSGPVGGVDVHVHFDDPALRGLIDAQVEPKIRASEQQQARRAKAGRA